MKIYGRILILALLAVSVSPLPSPAQQQNSYILQSPSLAQAQAVCQKYGMTLISTIHDPDTYLVQVSA